MIDFKTLLKEHGPRLIELASGITGSRSEAEDVVQEALLTAYRSRKRFRGDAAPATWVRRIVVNKAIDVRRRKRVIRQQSTEMDLMPRDDPEPATIAAGTERAAAVRQAVDALPEDQRVALMLKEFGGLTSREVAEQLGIPQGTVESRVIRARAHLREVLRSHLGEQDG
ncbi:RNA polymerase sigma factor [Planctomycetota bacterium]